MVCEQFLWQNYVGNIVLYPQWYGRCPFPTIYILFTSVTAPALEFWTGWTCYGLPACLPHCLPFCLLIKTFLPLHLIIFACASISAFKPSFPLKSSVPVPSLSLSALLPVFTFTQPLRVTHTCTLALPALPYLPTPTPCLACLLLFPTSPPSENQDLRLIPDLLLPYTPLLLLVYWLQMEQTCAFALLFGLCLGGWLWGGRLCTLGLGLDPLPGSLESARALPALSLLVCALSLCTLPLMLPPYVSNLKQTNPFLHCLPHSPSSNHS